MLEQDRGFRRLTLATAITVYALIIMGAIVRTTGSGLGCPDWPLCYGQVLPPPEITAMIEFSHRAIAGIGGLLMIATLYFAWRNYRGVRSVFVPIAIAIGLLVIQVPLGAIVVLTELQPLIVGFHLGMAMLIFAGVLITTLSANRPAGLAQAPSDAGQPRLTIAAAAATFVLLMSGAIVVGSGSQLSCPDWPLCYGGLLPPPNSSPLIALQLLHRYSVVAVSVLVVLVVVQVFRRGRAIPGSLSWAVWLGALFVMQVMVGAIQVLFYLPTVWRVLHVAFASGVWACLVLLATLAIQAGHELEDTSVVADVSPAKNNWSKQF